MQNNAPAKGDANPQLATLQPQWVPIGLYVLINKGTNMLLDLRGGEYEDKLRDSIYHGTQLLNQPVRKGTFDHGDFAIKVKDAVKTWARDRSPTDGYSVLFGVIYGETSKGSTAYNWYLSSNMKSLVFFDPQANKEYKSADLDSFGFKPSCAVL
ncbi:hypothetical protein FRC00_003118 [Tulasnella sp. 408]|nr:hypothetical protein FRC00_003118 [Tulasnella sp. 408]